VNEGWWVNFETGRTVALKCRGADHEAAIRDPKNQRWLGLPPPVIKGIRRFTPIQERDSLLLHIMKSSPLMRIRGHGAYVTFEFSSNEEYQPLDSIRKWVKKNAGPMTILNVVNFSSGQVRAVSVLPYQLEDMELVMPVRIDALGGSVNWRRSGVKRNCQ